MSRFNLSVWTNKWCSIYSKVPKCSANYIFATGMFKSSFIYIVTCCLYQKQNYLNAFGECYKTLEALIEFRLSNIGQIAIQFLEIKGLTIQITFLVALHTVDHTKCLARANTTSTHPRNVGSDTALQKPVLLQTCSRKIRLYM